MRGKKWFILLASLALVLLANSMGVTRSSFFDLESSTGNTFQAWASRQWTRTTQADFDAGVLNNVDTSSSPGNVQLATISPSPPTLVGSWAGERNYNTNGFNYTPGAGSNRVVLVMITAESNSFPVANINQVTLGGQTLTAIGNADGLVVGSAGSYHNLIWFGYLKETGIGNMSGNTLNITWDQAPDNPFGETMVQAATYQNVDQTVPIADSASNTNTSAGSIQAGSVSVGSDDRLVYVTVCGQPSDHTAPSGYTEQIEQDGPFNAHSDASVQRNATTAGTANPTATWSGTNRLAIISAVLNAVTSGSVSSGTIASQVLDTGISGARWDGLFWDEILPSGTNITFEVRASDTLSGGFPDASWVPVGGDSPVTSGLPSGRYMQWRATLTTLDTSQTPILQEVRVYHY